MPRLSEFTEQGLANLAWAFATASHDAPALLDALAAQAAPRLSKFTPQGLSMTSWAFATSSHPAPALFDALAAEALPRLDSFPPQPLATLAWAFALLGREPRTPLFGKPFARRCDQLTSAFGRAELSQLHMWLLWHAGECGRSAGLPGDKLLRLAREAFVSVPAQPSRLQRQVGQGLEALGLQPREEVVLPEGLSIDLQVEWRSVTVAVEVDGPSHFVAHGAEADARKHQTPTSATLLKRRQLRSFGLNLLSVPYWEWDALGDGRRVCTKLQMKYLVTALDGLVEDVSRTESGKGSVKIV